MAAANPSIVVVDDAVAVRARLCSALAELGDVDVRGCSAHEPEVLRLFAEVHPRCVVIDVPVRSSDGFALLDKIRSLDPSCLVVVVTNHVTVEFRRKVLEVGANHFLAKSTDIDALIDVLRNALARR